MLSFVAVLRGRAVSGALGAHLNTKRQLNGWQRIWTVLAVLSFPVALIAGIERGSKPTWLQVRDEIVSGYKNTECAIFTDEMSKNGFAVESDGETSCWDNYKHRTSSKDTPKTAAAYIADIEARRAEWRMGQIIVALVCWIIGLTAIYFGGITFSWIRRGFTDKH